MNMMRGPAERPWRAALARSRRAALEEWVERAIALLDALEDDPDLEPSLGAPELDPGLGLPWQHGLRWDGGSSQVTWAAGATDDREADDADEPEEPGVLMIDGHPEPDRRRVRRARNAGGEHVAA